MMDRRRILQQWKRSPSAALVTLVRAQGSSYRAPGAHLLIATEGAYAGSISGGCLEAEIVRKAEWMVRNGAIIQRYSTLFDDTAEIPYGLGCGGIVDLLIEPADTPECHALLDAIAASLEDRHRIVHTRLPQDGLPLRRAVFTTAGELLFHSEGLHPAALSATTPNDTNIYTEHLHPPLRLFVLGAGNDASPVVAMASLLGWNVIVADSRTQLARPERFPEAHRVTSDVSNLSISAQDAVVLMTHSYEQDRTLLTSLLRSAEPPGYIGLLGASHRSSLLVTEVAGALNRTVAQCCERIWSPVGLDLGGDGPEAIALSVVSEVQSWHNGKLAFSRRLTPERIAQQIANRTSSRYTRTECALG